MTLLEPDQRNLVIEPKLQDRFNKGFCQLGHLLAGGAAMAQVAPHKARHPGGAGQLRHVSVQVHPVDTLQFQDHMVLLECGDAFG